MGCGAGVPDERSLSRSVGYEVPLLGCRGPNHLRAPAGRRPWRAVTPSVNAGQYDEALAVEVYSTPCRPSARSNMAASRDRWNDFRSTASAPRFTASISSRSRRSLSRPAWASRRSTRSSADSEPRWARSCSGCAWSARHVRKTLDNVGRSLPKPRSVEMLRQSLSAGHPDEEFPQHVGRRCPRSR